MAAADIINRALEFSGGQVQITGTNPTFDGTPAGNAAGVLYSPAVQLLLRELDPDFARTAASLSAQANGTLIALTKWTQEYTYPATSLRLRQIRPAKASYDALDPQPILADVAFDPLSSGGPAKVILTNTASAIAVFTTSAVTEAQFDAAFAEALARLLANPMSMALAGRPDYARELLDQADKFAQRAELSEEL